MASAIAILDASYKCLISRTYRSTIIDLDEILENFDSIVDQNSHRPVFQYNGLNYIFIQNGEISIVMVAISDNANAMMLVSFLYRFNDVLMNYFKVKVLNRDLIVDNFNLIYELFDEMMDFGQPQLTETSILKDVIKLEANLVEKGKQNATADNDLDTSQEINSSILRSTTQAISWRPKGIFYMKNEFFLNVVEKIEIIHNFRTGKLIKFKINGQFDVRCYLSGMPLLKIGLNKLQNENEEFNNSLKFHQCVDLIKFSEENVIEFVPPDGSFKLMNYSIDYTKKKIAPLIQITQFEYKTPKKAESQSPRILRLKTTIKTNFPKNSSLSKLQLTIPIASKYLKDIDFKTTPKFKTLIGKVFYKVDQDCIIWTINSGIAGGREFTMHAQLHLLSIEEEPAPKELSMDPPPRSTKPNFDKIKNLLDDSESDTEHNDGNIKVEFELPDRIISGLKVDYLKILENGLDYTSFPWIKYVCMNDDDYIYRV